MSAPPAHPERVRLLGVGLDPVTLDEASGRVERALAEGRGGWVITPNLDILRRFVLDRTFAAMCSEAELMLADGMPLVWASRLQRTPLPERVAGSDFIFALCSRAATAGRSIFLLGGAPGAADAAATRLKQMYPGLRVAGALCPPFGFERDTAQMEAIRAALLDARPDIVFVGLGCPKQEHVIKAMRPSLPRAWMLGIGITFSFVAGDVRRAPRWMRRAGLEWVHRLMQEPRRLGRRYLVQGLPFAARLLVASAWGGITGSGRAQAASERKPTAAA